MGPYSFFLRFLACYAALLHTALGTGLALRQLDKQKLRGGVTRLLYRSNGVSARVPGDGLLPQVDVGPCESKQWRQERAANISAVAPLLLASALPLSQAPGSSKALLPYLRPAVLRVYLARPDRCGSPLAARLSALSQLLCGADGSPASNSTCQSLLPQALQAAITWVRDNLPMRLQIVPQQPAEAAAVWPDRDILAGGGGGAGPLAAAMTEGAQLQGTATAVEKACGLQGEEFAAAVAGVAGSLEALHADLHGLQVAAAAVQEPA